MLNSLRDLIKQRRNRKHVYSTADYWDSKAAIYDGTAVSMWPNQALNRLYEAEQQGIIQQHLNDVAGLQLLDLGCGTGRFSRWFAARGATVTGLDFSAGALAAARKLSAGVNPAYRLGSVFDLDENEAYDVVFTWGVLTIACKEKSQLLEALIRIRRALRKSGKLFITEPIHRGFLHRVLDMNLSEFSEALRTAGFRIEATAPMHFWPMRLLLAYVPWPMWITAPLYHLGQAAMKLPGLSRMGDYHAILAFPEDKN